MNKHLNGRPTFSVINGGGTRRYGVWCDVSGGVTGHRCSWLKVEGRIQVYETFEEAKAIAADIQRRVGASGARLTYEAREFTP